MIKNRAFWIVLIITATVAVVWQTREIDFNESSEIVEIALEGSPSTVDPPSVMDVFSSSLASAVHSPLAWISPNGTMMPMVAKTLRMSADGLSLEIEINEGVTFWDVEDSAVTAADVKASLEHYRRSSHPHRWILDRVVGVKEFDDMKADGIAGIEVISPDRLSLQYTQPEPDGALALCNLGVAIVKRGTGDLPAQPFGVQVIGCGPYAPGEFRPDSFTCYRRGSDSSKPARIIFSVIPDDQARMDSFQRGGADIVRLRGPMIGEATEALDGKLQPKRHLARGMVSVWRTNELCYNVFNWESPKLAAIAPAQRAAVLRKFSAALDRAKLVAELMPAGCAEATASVAPPMTGAPAIPSMIPPPPPDTPDTPPGLTLLAANDSASRQLAVAMQKQLAANGIKIETEFTDLGTLIGRLVKKEFDVVAAFWIELQIASSGPFAWCSFFDKGAPISTFGEPRDDVGGPLAEARGILDPAARAEAYRQVVKLINERHQSWVTMMSRKAVFVHDKRLVPWLDINGTPVHGLIRRQP